MDDDDFLSAPSTKRKKTSAKKKKKDAGADFLDSLLKNDTYKAERRKDHEEKLQGGVPADDFEIDWGYIKAAQMVNIERQLSQDSEADAKRSWFDDNFDEIVGCELPRRVSAPTHGRRVLAAARKAVCDASAGSDETMRLLQPLVRADDAEDLVEAATFVCKLVEASASRAVDARLARYLHATAAFDDRDEVSAAAARALRALATSEGLMSSLVDAETLSAVWKEWVPDSDHFHRALSPKELFAVEVGPVLGGGPLDDDDDALPPLEPWATVRLGRTLESFARAVANDACSLDRCSLLHVARLAAAVLAADVEVSNVERCAEWATKLARTAATKLAETFDDASAVYFAQDAVVPVDAAEHGAAEFFDKNRAAAFLIALRCLPLATAKARALTARATKGVLTSFVLAKTEFATFTRELKGAATTVRDSSDPPPSSSDDRRVSAGTPPAFVAEVLVTIRAALATVEADVGGGSADEPCLGSHSRLYTALACLRLLHTTVAADLAVADHALVHAAAQLVKRRLRHELAPMAVRSKELFDSWLIELADAATPPKTFQATLTSLFAAGAATQQPAGSAVAATS